MPDKVDRRDSAAPGGAGQADAQPSVKELPAGDGLKGPPSPRDTEDEVESHGKTERAASVSGTGKVKKISYFQLYRYADRTDKLLILGGIVGAGLNGAGMPVFSIVFGNLINSFGLNVLDPDVLKDQVNTIVPQFIYIGIACFVGSCAQMFCWTYTAVRQTNRIRMRYLQSVLLQDVGYFESETSPGALMQGLNEDCITIQSAIGDRMGRTLFNLFTAIIGIIVAFTRGWSMTLVMLAVTPLLMIAGFLIATLVARLTSRMNQAYAGANTLATQTLSNVRTVYAFNGEQRSLKGYEASLEDPVRVGIKQGAFAGMIVGFTNLVAFGAYALALWYGSTRILAGEYTGGQVLNVLFAALIGGFALGQAAPNLQYFQQGATSGARVYAVMEREPLINLDAPGEELKEVSGALSIVDVDFNYPARPDVPVLHGFSLEIAAGATVALVGESGSGKSTVIALLERFYDPTAGAVLLDGVDLRSLQLRWLRRQLSLVSQEPMLFATSIRDNIALGRAGATDAEVEAAARAANAHGFISALPSGYATHVGERGVQMSGGQKQRIAIARAILKAPKVLLLDEATSALDARSEYVVQRALDALMRACTTVVVAHRLSTVVGADVIAVVGGGRVVEAGTHAGLLAAGGAYATLVGMQRASRRDEAAVRAYEAEEDEEDDDDSGEGVAELGMAGSGRAASGGLVPADFGAPRRVASRTTSRTLSQPGSPVGARMDSLVGAADPAVMAPSKALTPGMTGTAAIGGWARFWKGVGATKGGKGGAPCVPRPHQRPDEAKPKAVSIGRIARLNKPELPALFFGLIGSGALGFMMPAFSIAFSSLISLFYTVDPEELKAGTRKWCLVFLGIGLGAMLFSIIQSYAFGLMGQRLGKRVRVLMMTALLRQEVGWFDQESNNSGVLTSKLSTDALAVKGQFGDTMGLLTQNLVTFIGGYALAFSHGWKMTLVVTSVVPLIVAAAWIQTKYIKDAATREDGAFAYSNQTAQEAVGNIRTIAAFAMERGVTDLYEGQLVEPTHQAKRRGRSGGLGFGFSQFVLFGAYSLAFWYAGLLVSRGESTLEEVLSVFFAIFLAAFGVAQSQMFFPDVAKGRAATERVFAIVDRVPAIDASDPSGDRIADCAGTIELVDVSFAYPLRPDALVFRDFSLSVPAGRVVALVGESGSGKSTVVGLVERFYDPLSGSVRLDGRDLRELNLKWLRSVVGLVSQEPVLFTMSVADNIRYGRPDASMEEVEAAARASNAHKFVARLPEGYHTLVGEGGIQLSGGQKQRIAIARAVIKDPKVLLLDEATSALDAESEAVVQEALDRLMANRTTIVVAHRLSTIRHANSIAVVYKGVIVESGTHDELMGRHHGAYARLVQHQLTGLSG
ncbi:ABC transporter B family member 4 [Auxenochlorella protothecoides]|uniref:ABC transporter B family member 4 n=2 Tax=Auxenochlorella protothecoides TaxID=3075 RepID=A0A087SMY6_AUXPR|nr:ABC transporter B family member 4 [Auxenochlorella protothecoides]KFM27090.1 ABC transporter B family member 4 [Auxenochlorella protothecoides]RMZ52333.1 hypothetical protein APUTEX25_005086 [Auxenochlorella protothecoides]|eukprot:RMZ52333.1 hypothetical protein APUTEX25_005086 [Auxenochlorella protothecoides]